MCKKSKDRDGSLFPVGFHAPSYSVQNIRPGKAIQRLGSTRQDEEVFNYANFPDSPVLEIPEGEPVYEIKNPFPFWGTTYILKRPADEFKKNPLSFSFKKAMGLKRKERARRYSRP